MSTRMRRIPLFLVLSLTVTSLQAATPERVMAVWKEREISFLYRSSTVIYECDALRDRVASILRAVGARPDVNVRVDHCDHFIDPHADVADTRHSPMDRYRSGSDWFGNERLNRREQSSNVRIRLVTPIEVTPDVLEEVKKEKSRRELIARVTGNPTALIEATGQFPAQWQTIELSRQSIGLEPEECELLEQLSMRVFRELGIREVRKSMMCNSREVSRIAPRLTVEALVSAPWATSPAQQAPPAAESESQPSEPAPAEEVPAQRQAPQAE